MPAPVVLRAGVADEEALHVDVRGLIGVARQDQVRELGAVVPTVTCESGKNVDVILPNVMSYVLMRCCVTNAMRWALSELCGAPVALASDVEIVGAELGVLGEPALEERVVVLGGLRGELGVCVHVYMCVSEQTKMVYLRQHSLSYGHNSRTLVSLVM